MASPKVAARLIEDKKTVVATARVFGLNPLYLKLSFQRCANGRLFISDQTK